MRAFLLFFAFSILSFASKSQTIRPKIGIDALIIAKLDTIHNNMHQLVKAFGKNPDKSSEYRTKYQSDFVVGKTFLRLSEDKDDEKLEVSFSHIYYDGSIADFKKFYADIVKQIGIMLKDNYYLEPQKAGSIQVQSIYYETGKNVMNSSTSVYIDYSDISGKYPSVTLYFYKKK